MRNEVLSNGFLYKRKEFRLPNAQAQPQDARTCTDTHKLLYTLHQLLIIMQSILMNCVLTYRESHVISFQLDSTFFIWASMR